MIEQTLMRGAVRNERTEDVDLSNGEGAWGVVLDRRQLIYLVDARRVAARASPRHDPQMHLLPSHPGRALAYAVIMLAAGFLWGAVAANVPSLRGVRGIPYLANNWAIALPVFTLWVGTCFLLSRRYLQLFGGGPTEGLRLGAVFALAGLVFDAVFVAGLIGQGLRHFKQPVLWVAYALLLLIPWFIARTQ